MGNNFWNLGTANAPYALLSSAQCKLHDTDLFHCLDRLSVLSIV